MAATVESKDEVKKLQDLVKKLEKQNELLRSKGKTDADGIGSPEQQLSPSRNRSPDAITKSKSSEFGSTNNLLESVKLLDLNLLEDDDDTWLYTSPIRAPTPEQKVVDPRSWIRQDFENPEPDEKMKSAKKALLAKLDEVSRANRNSMGPNAFIAPSQVPALSQQAIARPPSPPVAAIAAAASTEPPTATATAVHNHSPSHSPLHSPSHSRSSSSTNLSNLADASLGVGVLDSSPVSSPPTTPSRRERKSSEERLSFAKLEDVTDVQILAKMQEESLRQATQQSPANSPRRVSSNLASSDQALHRAVSRTSSQSSMSSDKDDMDGVVSTPRESTGVVRRRPSLERLRKNPEQGNVRRYSYGAKYPSNHVNDHGEAVSLADLQKLAQDKKAKRHTSSLPNLNKSPKGKANSKLKAPALDAKTNRLKQPQRMPTQKRQQPPAASTTTNNNKKIEKAKGHSGSLPNLNRSYTAQQNSNSQQQSGSTEPAEPKMKQPQQQQANNGVTVKRSPTNPSSKSGLRQPSPTKLRAASPSRSGIPVRLGLAERSAIPRPRSVQNMNRSNTRSKDDSWREGCY